MLGLKNPLLVLTACLGLLGCEGSGFMVSRMSPSQLLSVDNYTLCKAATPRELYSPSYQVVQEVRRRGLNCGIIYTYNNDGTKLMELGARIAGGSATQQRQNNVSINHVFLGSQVEQGTRLCRYKNENGVAYSIYSTSNSCRQAPKVASLISQEVINGSRVCTYSSQSRGYFLLDVGARTCSLP